MVQLTKIRSADGGSAASSRSGTLARAALALLTALGAQLWSTRALAQSEPPRQWTEAAVVTRASHRSPEVQAARFALETARASTAHGRVPRVGNPVVGGRSRNEAAGRFREALDLTSADPAIVAPLAPPGAGTDLTRDAAVRLAVARRREVAAGHAAAQRLAVSEGRLRAQYVGPLWVTPEAALSNTQTAQTTAGATVQWALPLLQTGQGERAVARAQGEASRAEGLRAARRADREAGNAWDVLHDRLRELAALEGDAIPALERTLRATERRLESGEADFFLVLYARRELALMRVRAVGAARDAWRARVALQRAVGAVEGGGS